MLSPYGVVTDEDIPPGWERVPSLYIDEATTLMYDSRPGATVHAEYRIERSE